MHKSIYPEFNRISGFYGSIIMTIISEWRKYAQLTFFKSKQDTMNFVENKTRKRSFWGYFSKSYSKLESCKIIK